jgi:hypothetical protein
LVKKKATPHPHAEGTEIGLGVLLYTNIKLTII